MLKLFDIKSSCNRDKTAYHILAKQYLASSGLSWAQLPTELVSESLVRQAHDLLQPAKIISQLGEVQDVSAFEASVPRFDSKFRTMLELFLSFYKHQVRQQLEFFRQQFEETVSKFKLFLGSPEPLETLQSILQLAARHSKFADQIKKAKAAKNKQPGNVTNFTPSKQEGKQSPPGTKRRLGSPPTSIKKLSVTPHSSMTSIPKRPLKGRKEN
jgi:hypothetical protein